MLRAVSAIVSILLSVSALTPLAQAAERDWSNVFGPGASELRDGMLVHDQLIVHFAPGMVPALGPAKDGRPSTNQLELNALNDRFGTTSLERVFPEVSAMRKSAQPAVRDLVYVLRFDGARHALKDVAAAYLALPSVTHVEPNSIHFATAEVPNDPSLAQQTWLRASSVNAGDIRALAAWYQMKGDPDVLIAIADTGVDWEHPDLGGTEAGGYRDGVIWNNWTEINGTEGVDDDGNGYIDDTRGWDVIHVPTIDPRIQIIQNPPQDVLDPDNDPMDYDGHGTMVAGCAGAMTDNGIGVAGASWGCSIVPIRIGFTVRYVETGEVTGISYTLFQAQALDYARLSGARVFNLSYGNSDSGGLPTATTMAVQAGVIVIESAGNNNDNQPSYLGSRADCLSIAAVTPGDSKASFSTYGTWVDLSAPGTGIYTTAFNRSASGANRHTYATTQGTSFSAPIVAGAAGLLLSYDPGLTGPEARDALRAATDDIRDKNPGFEIMLGTGRLNMAKFFPLPPQWTVPEILPTYVDAMSTAGPGDEVAIAASVTIEGRISLPSKPITILGGYDDTFTSRDPVGDPTVIDAMGATGAVVFGAGADTSPVLDGFEIRGGKATLQSGEPIDGIYGGGIVLKNEAAPVFRNIFLHDNIAGIPSQHGGGAAIAVLDADPVFEDVRITGNSGSQGSAIYVHRGAPVFRRVDIYDNVSYPTGFGLAPAGGAVYVINTGNVKDPEDASDGATFEDCTITGHAVEGPGGAIYAENSNLVLTGVTIENNSAAGDGGGIYVSGGSYAGIDNVVQSNSIVLGSFKSGGGLFASNTVPVTIDGSIYAGNSCDFAGGGLNIGTTDGLEIRDTFVVDNSAGLVGSGAYLTSSTNTTFTGNTVAGNTGAAQGGNGLFLAGGTAAVTNSIFAVNGGGGMVAGDGVACSGGTVTFSCNLVHANDAANYSGCDDPTGTDGNVEVDPLFCDAAAGDYAVGQGSPAAPGQSGGCGLIGADTCFLVPVAMSLSAALDATDVVLRWRTGGDAGLVGYQVFRARDQRAPQPVSQRVALRSDRSYSYRDVAPNPGRYAYQIAEISGDGSIYLHDPVEIQVTSLPPRQVFLDQNAPNPFNPSTTLRFGTSRPGRAVLEVHDARGRRVRVLLEEENLEPGTHRVDWDGRDDAGRLLSSGVYHVRLRLPDRQLSRRMLLLK